MHLPTQQSLDIRPLPPRKWRRFRRIALECGQWDRQPLPLQCRMFRIGVDCGRASARPYHKKPTPERSDPPACHHSGMRSAAAFYPGIQIIPRRSCHCCAICPNAKTWLRPLL